MIANSPSMMSFLIILIGVVWGLWLGVRKSWPQKSWHVAIGSILWLVLYSAVVASGFLQAAPFPRLPILLGMVILVSLLFALSPVGKKMAFGIPIYILAGFQVFRFPLELVLHSWAVQGVVPWTMTWNGSNWDIISGILGGVAWFWGRQSRQILWLANVVGSVLLLNVMRVAVLSSPIPFGWELERPLLLGFYLPYSLIVPVCIGGALAGHVILTRALLRK